MKEKKGEMEVRRNIASDDMKKKCVECGVGLGVFEGYRHPTRGIHYLMCRECFETIELSVERRERFVLWNSFNPEAPDPTFIDNFPSCKKMQQYRIKK